MRNNIEITVYIFPLSFIKNAILAPRSKPWITKDVSLSELLPSNGIKDAIIIFLLCKLQQILDEFSLA